MRHAAIATGLAFWIVTSSGQILLSVERSYQHLQKFFVVHRAPRFSVDGASVIQAQTALLDRSLNAQHLIAEPMVLIGDIYQTDTWPFRMDSRLRVRSLFLFGECPYGGAESGIRFEGECERRQALRANLVKILELHPLPSGWIRLEGQVALAPLDSPPKSEDPSP